MPRLAFALISVLGHVAAQETRITDPTAATISQRAQLYELMKAEYTDEGCAAAGWGPFPMAVSSIEEGLFLVKRAESSRRLRGARV